MKILICAPDRDLLASLSGLLSLSGWETKTAHDGVMAAELIGTEKFDAALVDERLPRIRAGDVIAELGEAGCPALLMTESGSRDGLPAIEYPFTPDELLAALGGTKERDAKNE